jgi:hypothetical protein
MRKLVLSTYLNKCTKNQTEAHIIENIEINIDLLIKSSSIS